MFSGDYDDGQTQRLLLALTEQLKLPLLQIRNSAESGNSNNLQQIDQTAAEALRLIDTYLLSARANQQELQLSPVSLSSVLYDTAQDLQQLASQYHCDLELQMDGRYGPIMADKPSLQAALITLGQSMIQAGNQESRSKIVLAGYKTADGLRAGVFSNQEDLTPEAFRRALDLYAKARSVMPTTNVLNAAGIYIADALCQAMKARLRVAHHDKLVGLAATFLPSGQLSLV